MGLCTIASNSPSRGMGAARVTWRGLLIGFSSLLTCALGCAHSSTEVPPPVTAAEQDDEASRPQAPPSVQDQRFCEEWVSSPAQIVFEDQPSELDDADRALLHEFSVVLQHREDVIRVRVEGYIDGARENKQGLAMERARAVIDHMVTALLLPEELFEAVDMGDGADYTTDTVDNITYRRVGFSILMRSKDCPNSNGADRGP